MGIREGKEGRVSEMRKRKVGRMKRKGEGKEESGREVKREGR